MTINEAVAAWLNYADKDIYSEEEGIKLINARITIREALRSGYILINPEELFTELIHLIQQKEMELNALKKTDRTSWSELDYTRGYIDSLKHIQSLLQEAAYEKNK